MDARRCISYLTIEHRGPIPRELRAQVGNRIYGCDICQEVCPWNVKFQAPAGEPAYRARPELDGPLLVELAERLLAMDDAAFSRAFRGSPVKRARRNGLLRNVCVGLGNRGGQDAIAVLILALQDGAPLVRGHAAWGLGRIGESADAAAALRARMEVEDDAWVREEIAGGAGIGLAWQLGFSGPRTVIGCGPSRGLSPRVEWWPPPGRESGLRRVTAQPGLPPPPPLASV